MDIDIRKPVMSDDSLSVSSDSSSDDEADEKVLNDLQDKIKIFRKQINQNCLDYDAHVNLINGLRQLGELDDLRKAREEMNIYFPLSPDLWSDWLKDEQKICTEPAEREFVISLFERALGEYKCVIVWVEYVMFILGCGDVKKTRSVCDRALMASGIDVAEGAMIWQAVSLVEQQIYVSILSSEDEDKVNEQKKRLQALYRRQARVPLLNVDKESFLAEASKWFDEDLDQNIARDFEKSLKNLKGKAPHENKLKKAENETEKLEAYRKYIDYVIKNDTPTGVQNIYERMVADISFNATLWEEYVRFAMEQFRFADYVVLPVCERSQKNCPWSAVLCELHITAIQYFSNVLSHDDANLRAKGSLDKFLNSSNISDKDELMQGWMSYLVFLRRRIECKSENVNKELSQFYQYCDLADESLRDLCGEEGDPFCEIVRFKAHVGLLISRDIEHCRKSWNEKVMKKNNNFKNTDLWLEFIRLERQFGSEVNVRKLFRRSLEYAWNDVEEIGKAFRAFESEVGTVETMEEFNKRYKDRLSIVTERRKEEEGNSRNPGGKNSKRYEKENKNFMERGKKETRKDRPLPNTKPQNRKDPVVTAPLTKGLIDEIEPPPGYKRASSEDAGNSFKKSKTESDESHGEFVKHDHSKDNRSVFLSNLDYSTSPSDIAPIFVGCGEQEELRLVRDFKGRSKGFGYLIFKDFSSVNDALKLDRTPIGSRPMFVSRCSVSSREKAFKFSSGEEKCKLFVKGLPFSMNEQQVKEAFEVDAKVKAIRLVTFKTGDSKGMCFVEFEDAKTANDVRQKMDQTEHDGKTITVLISNPGASAKNTSSSFDKSSQPIVSLSATPRPSLSLMPRALIRKKQKTVSAVKAANGNANSSSRVEKMETENTEKETSSANHVKLSNQDFRKMLLK